MSAGLGLLTPYVALALVLAYGFGHVHGAFRVFLGFVSLATFAGALPSAIGLGQALRVGRLKVRGVIVQRLAAPRRFWTWVAVEALVVAAKVAAAVFLAWVTVTTAP